MATFILGIGDTHNDNIMVSENGQVSVVCWGEQYWCGVGGLWTGHYVAAFILGVGDRHNDNMGQ